MECDLTSEVLSLTDIFTVKFLLPRGEESKLFPLSFLFLSLHVWGNVYIPGVELLGVYNVSSFFLLFPCPPALSLCLLVSLPFAKELLHWFCYGGSFVLRTVQVLSH